MLEHVASGVNTLEAQLRQQMHGGVDQLKAKLAFYPPASSYVFEEDPQLGALQMWIGGAADARMLAAAPGFSVFWVRKQHSGGSGAINPAL